ncbi:MAG: hypothetical protein NVS4B12_15550 [Ktedonobacteraceae bacterium]
MRRLNRYSYEGVEDGGIGGCLIDAGIGGVSPGNAMVLTVLMSTPPRDEREETDLYVALK